MIHEEPRTQNVVKLSLKNGLPLDPVYSHSCFALTRARRPKQETVFMILQVWTFVLYQISWPPKIAGNGTDNIFYIWKALEVTMLLK